MLGKYLSLFGAFRDRRVIVPTSAKARPRPLDADGGQLPDAGCRLGDRSHPGPFWALLFTHAFPGAFTINVQPAVGADPELKDPILVRLKFDESLRPALVKFAHMKDMDIELLFDKLTEEVVERMRRRKMIPDTVRHLVE